MGGGIGYKDAGVDYAGGIDGFKRAAARAGWETEAALPKNRFGFESLSRSRGGSVFLSHSYTSDAVRGAPGVYKTFGSLIETLGTKCLVADAMYRLTGDANYYRNIPQDAVAMVVNDAATGGVAAHTIHMLLEVGSSDWFKDAWRSEVIIEGWRDACIKARCVWGGGETPVLSGLLYPGVFSLSGSATGVSLHPCPEDFSDGSLIQDKDIIIFVMGNGIHANGLSLARLIAERKDPWLQRVKHFWLNPADYPLQALPDGYLTPLSDDRAYGEALLDPTPPYNILVEDCLVAGVDLHYVANITGHGLRKLMRPSYPFAYMVDRLPPKLPIFEFMQQWGPIDDKEAHESLNMGPGYALYVPPQEEERVIAIAQAGGFEAYCAGHIYACQRKQISLPNGIEWYEHDLSI